MDELLSRSVAEILPSKKELEEQLRVGKKLTIYLGVDATGPTLHLGHATNLLLLERFRKLGHKIIVLFGDFTAQIGDPSGRDSSRVPLTNAQVSGFIKSWKSQVAKVLDLNNKTNPVTFAKNSSWLSKLSMTELLKLSSNFTVSQMIERDMFQERIKNKKPIHLHEFLYPLFQGYDSVAMNVDMEIGGTDQTFNMLAGRTLQKIYNHKEKFVLSTTLLVNPKTDRKLMSKSEGSLIGLTDSSTEMFGKTMALPDEVIIQVFIDCTNVSMSEINKYKNDLKEGKNPRDIKLELAKALVSLYHHDKEAKSAEKDFLDTYQKKGVPSDISEIKVKTGEKLVEILLAEKIIKSKTEFIRLINTGSITVLADGSKIKDKDFKISQNTDFKIGKHRFLKVKV